MGRLFSWKKYCGGIEMKQLSDIDKHEIAFSLGQAKRWLGNYWKHLGKGYAYRKREKEAEWHIEYALLIMKRYEESK